MSGGAPDDRGFAAGRGRVDAATRRVLALTRPAGSRRLVIGIAGSPGSGKSTLAADLQADLERVMPGRSVLVPMDGFHLAQRVLEDLGRTDRKGAPDTFDAAGFVALVERIRGGAGTIYAPAFERSLEEPIAGAIPVSPTHRIVLLEGNYLLLDDHGFGPVAALLDEAWFVSVAPVVRRERLIARHRAHGRSEAEARERSLGSDEINARLIDGTAARADLLVEWD